MNAIAGAREILGAWPIGEVMSLREPGAGSINQTLLVAAASGRYALRAYRSPERAWVEREHAIIAFVRAAGLPAVAPLPLPGDDTIFERGGRCFALFPHAPGRQLARHELQEAEVAAMGSFLARLHLALADYPTERVQARPLAIDRPGALAAIERHSARIAALPARSASDDAILERLEGQRAWIAAHPDASTDALALLPQQAIHGDYQEANLFFERGAVSAIIDWDQAYVAARAWELVRAFDLVFRFGPPCAAMLAAYRERAPMPLEQLDAAARCYAAVRAHDVWMYDAVAAGNDRVRAFIRPGGFAPLDAQWEALRETL
jgi:homoserine kinase type II